MVHSRSFMDRHKSELHQLATGAWARSSATAGVKIFQIETTLNNDTFGTPARVGLLKKREWEWTATRPGRVRRG